SSGCCNLRRTSAFSRRRWRRWRRWRRERFQELQSLSPRAQLAVEQQHEDIIRDLRILRQLRRNVQLCHFRQGNLLLHLPPLREEILNLLLHALLPCGHRQKQNHLRPCVRQHLPSARRSRCLFPHQPFGKVLGVVLGVLPFFPQRLARNQLAHVRDFLIPQPGREEIHDGRRRIRLITQL